MIEKCHGCGIEKDPTALETYPYPGDNIFDEEPIEPFFDLCCVGESGGCRAVHVCHECFHRLDPDMWINRKMYEWLNPTTPFDELPIGCLCKKGNV
jgi:hypothetical protein